MISKNRVFGKAIFYKGKDEDGVGHVFVQWMFILTWRIIFFLGLIASILVD